MPPRERQLAAVLTQRRLVEDDRRRAVAELQRRRAAIDVRVRERARSFQSIRADLRSALDPATVGGRVGFDAVRAQAGASLAVQTGLHALAIEAAGVHRRLEAARASLAQAGARRRAVEHLLDRLLAERRARADRREALELDEISTARAARADEPGEEPPL